MADRKTKGPMRVVKKHERESVTKISRGFVNGSQNKWAMRLECGHVAIRYSKSDKPPKRARCEHCPKEAPGG